MGHKGWKYNHKGTVMTKTFKQLRKKTDESMSYVGQNVSQKLSYDNWLKKIKGIEKGAHGIKGDEHTKLSKQWRDYKKENNKPLALRTSYKSSSDFVGWYFYKSNQINNIPLNDIKKLYLNYYLGWSGYKNKTYRTDQKAILLAKKVEKQADKYRIQLKKCQKKVNRKKYIIY